MAQFRKFGSNHTGRAISFESIDGTIRETWFYITTANEVIPYSFAFSFHKKASLEGLTFAHHPTRLYIDAEKRRGMKKSNLKTRLLNSAALLSVLVLFSACATDIGSKSYSDEDVGAVANTQEGVVLKVRTVKVGPDQLGKSKAGAAIGGVGGALIGAETGSGLATIGLGAAGAVGGAFVEKGLKTQQGLEITVRLTTGSLRTVVQGNDVSFVKGEKVLLLVYDRGRSKVVKEDDQS
jgi:outer membrane lipoprotein SlyB